MPEKSANASQTVLAVDTSQSAASYAICRDGEEIALVTTSGEAPHSLTFFPLIESLLKQAEVSLPDISGFAAVTGPGSFTGLRVAISALQGLAQTLNVPAYGLNTLDVLAIATETLGRVLVAHDSVRGDVFLGARFMASGGELLRQVPDCCVPLTDLPLHWLPETWQQTELTITGDGRAHRSVQHWASNQNLTLNESVTASPLASVLGCYLSRQLLVGQDLSAYPLQACYIRPADAEMKAL